MYGCYLPDIHWWILFDADIEDIKFVAGEILLLYDLGEITYKEVINILSVNNKFFKSKSKMDKLRAKNENSADCGGDKSDIDDISDKASSKIEINKREKSIDNESINLSIDKEKEKAKIDKSKKEKIRKKEKKRRKGISSDRSEKESSSSYSSRKFSKRKRSRSSSRSRSFKLSHKRNKKYRKDEGRRKKHRNSLSHERKKKNK